MSEPTSPHVPDGFAAPATAWVEAWVKANHALYADQMVLGPPLLVACLICGDPTGLVFGWCPRRHTRWQRLRWFWWRRPGRRRRFAGLAIGAVGVGVVVGAAVVLWP